MLKEISSGASLATAGVVVGFFILQSWSSRSVRKPTYYGQSPPVGSPEYEEDVKAQQEYNVSPEQGKQESQGRIIPYDHASGTCPSGYQKVWKSYGEASYPVCQEIITN